MDSHYVCIGLTIGGIGWLYRDLACVYACQNNAHCTATEWPITHPANPNRVNTKKLF